MLTFTLAISCLTTSNLPWFMDITFQVPVQYRSLQHWPLLLSPVTSTTGCWFCFVLFLVFFFAPSCGERALLLAKVMRKEAWHTQRWDQASGVSLEILEHLPPKTRVCLLSAFTYTSDFTGGCPPLPLSEKRVNLQLQLIIPGCDSVSTYKLLWKSSSLPE